MKNTLILLFILVLSAHLYGQDAVNDFRSNAASFTWSTVGSWQRCSVAGNPGTWITATYYPGNGTTGLVTIQTGQTVTFDVSAITIGALTVGQGISGTLNMNATASTSRTLTITNTLTIKAGSTLNCTNATGTNTHTLNVGGDFLNSGTFTSTIGDDHINVVLNGANSVNISDVGAGVQTVFYNLTINKSSNGATVTNPVTSFDFHVDNLLTVTQGNLILSSGTGGSDYNMGSVTVSYNATGPVYGTVTQSSGSNRIYCTGSIACDGMWVPSDGCEITFTSTTGTVRSNPLPEHFSSPPSQFPRLAIEAGANIQFTGGAVRIKVATGAEAIRAPNYQVGASTLTITSSAHLYSNGVWNPGGQPSTNSTLSILGPVDFDGDIVIWPGVNVTCSSTFNITGNWTNNGTGTFTSTSSTVSFNGTNAQSIGGTSATTFNNLTINNTATPPTVSLTANAQVNSTLTMTSGRLVLGAFNLILNTNNAIVAGSAFGTSNMIQADGTGYISKSITTTGSYTYPVGSNTNNLTYSPATINFTAGTFSSAYLNVNLKDVYEPHKSKSNYLKRYWTLSTTGTFTSPLYTATYTYADGDVNILSSETNLVAAKYTSNPMTYFSNAVNTSSNTLSFPSASGFSNFTAEGDLGVTASATPNPICTDGSGLASASISGGTPAYAYLWSNSAITSVTSVSPLATATYTVTVTDSYSAQATSSVTLTVNALPSYSVTQTNISCYNGIDGKIIVTASGGSGTGYEFSKNNGIAGSWTSGAGNPYTFNGLSANVPYKIRVMDSNGCMSAKLP